MAKVQQGFISVIAAVIIILVVATSAFVLVNNAFSPVEKSIPILNEEKQLPSTPLPGDAIGNVNDSAGKTSASDSSSGDASGQNIPAEGDGSGSVEAIQTLPAVPSILPIVFTPPSVSNSLPFCERLERIATQVLANESPSNYIAASVNKNYLELWEKLFLERNNIDAAYFDKHIRIVDSSVVEPTELDTGYFFVNYYFVVDWFSVSPMIDVFTVKEKNGKQLTNEEIIGLFSESWGDPENPPYYIEGNSYLTLHGNFISSIRADNLLLESVPSCTVVLNVFLDKSERFNSFYTSASQGLLLVDGLTVPTYNSIGNIDPPGQRCPTGTYDLSVEKITAFDLESPCGSA